MKVIVTGKQDRRVMLALVVLGADVVTSDEFVVRPREITGAWMDELPAIAKERNTYGPPVKGKGGKIKRW